MGTASGGTSPLSFKRLGVAGIANSTLGSLLTAIGLLLQQRSTRVSKDRVGLARFRSLEYTMGVTLVAAGGISALVGEGILPLSTLAPLATQTVIFKAIGGKVLLGETISIQKWIAMALIFTGLVVSMIGANLEDAHYDLQHLLYLFEQPQAMFYTVAVAMFLFCMRRIIRRYYYDELNNYIGLAYLAVASGVIAGWTSVLTKAVVELTLTAVVQHDGSDYRHMGTYLFFLLIPWFLGMKFKYISIGVSTFQVRIFMPLYQVLTVTSHAVCGIIYYQDFSEPSSFYIRKTSQEEQVEESTGAGGETEGFVDVTGVEEAAATERRQLYQETNPAAVNMTFYLVGMGLTLCGLCVMMLDYPLGGGVPGGPSFDDDPKDPLAGKDWGSKEYWKTTMIASPSRNNAGVGELLGFGFGADDAILEGEEDEDGGRGGRVDGTGDDTERTALLAGYPRRSAPQHHHHGVEPGGRGSSWSGSGRPASSSAAGTDGGPFGLLSSSSANSASTASNRSSSSRSGGSSSNTAILI